MTAIETDGDCFRYVLQGIERDLGSTASGNVQASAIDLVGKCVDAYSQAFGVNDVGHGGTGKVARPFEPTQRYPVAPGTNGLLYGRVQSGKTNVTIATAGLAHANAFRCFIVLTSDNTWLGLQTATRFREQLAHAGPVVKYWEEWRSDPAGLGQSLRGYVDDTGVAFITTKNPRNLEHLIEVLRGADCGRVPAIIIDDEADNASLNTNVAAQARSTPGTVQPSRIFSLIGDIRDLVPNHVYLQVTATPQSLLLQGLSNPLRPSFCVIAPPGSSYVGGDTFFSEGSPHVLEVPVTEINDLRANRVNPGDAWSMPAGLRHAICCFVLGSAFREITTGGGAGKISSMLVHIDHRRFNHDQVGLTIQNFIAELDRALRGRLSPSKRAEAERWLELAYEELARTERSLPPLREMQQWIEQRLRNASPQIINADNPRSEPEYRPGMNVLIGGNRLGRGVTIRGLLVTYYGRDPRVQMMDTVHQHARMFGYRAPLLSVTRLFSARHLLNSFRAIHEADQGTREVIGDDSSTLRVKPVWVGPQLRPTRANVLNPADIGAIVGGRQIWPRLLRTKRADIETNVRRLDEILSRFTDEGSYYEVPIEELIKILRLIPSDPDPASSWDDQRVVEVLRAVRVDPVGIETGRLNVRRGSARAGLRATRDGQLVSGFISGQQQQEVRRMFPRNPALLLRREEGRKEEGWHGHPFWAPTLVFPNVGFVFMFTSG